MQTKIKTKINTKNTPYLVIVESPYKCKKIEKFLGFQYKCIASNGHFREISKIIPNTDKDKAYEPIFEIIPLKKKHVENMRETIAYFLPENIFLGTDDDREGEAIAWHICNTFQLPIEKVNRILFHEITETAIKKSVENPLKIRMNIVLAQHARQVLDRLVGFKISPLLSKRMNSIPLSAGRCQTPALRLIYDREITNEKKEEKNKKTQYQIHGYFFSQNNIKFELSKKLTTKEECISFLEKSKEFSHELTIGIPIQKKQSAPLPLNTSSLLQSINTILQLSSKETMYYCQQLYQAGYITYMRTESTKYSEMYLLKAREYISDTYSPEFVGDLSLLQNQNSPHEAHEAIRITNLNCSTVMISVEKEKEKDKENRQKIYDFIRKRSIESCMSNYIYNEINIQLTCPLIDVYYKYNIDIPIFIGWKRNINPTNQENGNSLLFYLQCVKSPIKYIKIECEEYISEKNRYYTEAGLIRDLEEYGIGRPSTFSIILETIQERNYVMKKNIEGQTIKTIDIILQDKKEIIFVEKERIIGTEKNKLVLQELGKRVIEELIPTFHDLFSYDYTNKMELELDKISNNSNNMKWNDICKDCDDTIKRNSKQWKLEMKQIYTIDSDHELLFIKTGMIIRKISKKEEKEEYKRIKTNIKIDFEKLRNKEYNLEELLEVPNYSLGDYEGYPLFLKKGQYGLYVTWGENKSKIAISKKIDEIQLQDIVEYLSRNKQSNNKFILRVLNERISIRKGKYGNYIHYSMPSKSTSNVHCYNLKLFPGNYLNCEINELLVWLENTYGII
jgi:DNA topoisomerase-1